jgi:hypothetical protein
VLTAGLMVDQLDNGHAFAAFPVAALAERLHERVVFQLVVDRPAQDAGAFSVVDAQGVPACHERIVEEVLELWQCLINSKPVQVEFLQCSVPPDQC